MKKSIALVLALILVLSIAAVAFAACNHSWYTVNTRKVYMGKRTIAYQHGCIYCSNPHTHTEYSYRVTETKVCSKGCGTTTTISYNTTEEKCPAH